jgi:RNA polymerase sigma factor (sigma-70 family)
MSGARVDAQKIVAARDDELLAEVARRKLEPDAAHRAQAEFYARHVRYLYGVLQRHPDRLLQLAGASAEDIVQETFHRAFERAHTFSIDDAEDPLDEERLRRRARAWLGRIAQNLLADHLRRFREVSASPYLERLSCEEIERPAPPSPELELVIAGLGELSDREQDVLRVTALYQRSGDHQRLPNSVSAELASRWGTTSENIRAIRSRAMKKLRSFITARGLAVREVP